MLNHQVLTTKCVLVIDQDLPLGVMANTIAVLSLSLGKLFPEMIGDNFNDQSGNMHHGITTIPIPILKAAGSLLKDMRQAIQAYTPNVTIIDLIHATRTTKSYADYVQNFTHTESQNLEYLGLALYGEKKSINKFTGSLGLLR